MSDDWVFQCNMTTSSGQISKNAKGPAKFVTNRVAPHGSQIWHQRLTMYLQFLVSISWVHCASDNIWIFWHEFTFKHNFCVYNLTITSTCYGQHVECVRREVQMVLFNTMSTVCAVNRTSASIITTIAGYFRESRIHVDDSLSTFLFLLALLLQRTQSVYVYMFCARYMTIAPRLPRSFHNHHDCPPPHICVYLLPNKQ